MLVGMLALIDPVITLTDILWVGKIKWITDALAFCESSVIKLSACLPTTIIISVSSSISQQ